MKIKKSGKPDTGKVANPSISSTELYDWAWAVEADGPGKLILLALADNGGATTNLRGLLDELKVFMPAPKMHLGKLQEAGLIHPMRGVAGGWVLDLAVDDAGQPEVAA